MSGETKYFRVHTPKDWSRYELWVRRKPKWIPIIVKSKAGVPKYIKITHVGSGKDELQLVDTHANVGCWVEKEHTPLEVGYVRESSRKYREWQILAFEGATGKIFQTREADEFDVWVAANPPRPSKALSHPGPVSIL